MNSHANIDPVAVEGCQAPSLHPEHVAALDGRVLSRAASEPVTALFALLADPTRARLLHALSLIEELCVCDLAAVLGLSQSATSHQLRLLRTAGLVRRRKAGRVVYYALADAHVRHVLADALRHADEVGPQAGLHVGHVGHVGGDLDGDVDRTAD